MADLINIIVQLVSNVGFPIACVFVMFYMWNKENHAHKEESLRWATALNNNTEALNEIKLILSNGGYKNE